MLFRTSAVIPLARKALLLNTPAVTAMSGRLAHGHGPPANYKFPTMDDMLVPCGSWQEDYNNKQRRYNIHLLFGTGFLLVTIAVGIFSGHLDLYLSMPEKPAPRINAN